MRLHQLQARLASLVIVAGTLCVCFVPLPSFAADGETSDLRYLLVRRAGGPEKNYYDLSRTAVIADPPSGEEIRKYKPSPRNYGFDIVSERTVRYGVYQVWRVRVVSTSDTRQAPISTKNAVYVLLYPRNPDWIFCAKQYRLASTTAGARKLTYTDFQDKKEYTLELSPEWPRPWQVYEIEIVNSNSLGEIWQAQLATGR